MSAAPTAAPPAAPAAPAATPTPAPVPAPPPAAQAAPAAADNPFAEIDKAFRNAGQTPPPEPGKPAAPAAPKDKTVPGSLPATPPKGTPAPPAPRGATPELREQYNRIKADHDALTKKSTEYQTRIAELERNGQDSKVLTERLADLEKKLSERDSELAAVRQEASPEFIAKHDRPFNDFTNKTKQLVEEMQVNDAATGTARQAKWEDFTALFNMPYGQAWAKAKELFGDAAPGIMGRVDKLKDMLDSRQTALAEQKAKWAEDQKSAEARRLQSQTEINTAWTNLNKQLTDTVEEYRDPVEDKELADARLGGLRVFDSTAKTPEQRMIKNAHIRQRAAAFAPNQITIRRQKQRIVELEAEIEQLRNPTPQPRSVGGTGAAPAGGSGKSWEEEARQELI